MLELVVEVELSLRLAVATVGVEHPVVLEARVPTVVEHEIRPEG